MIHHIVVSDTMTDCFCGRGVFRPWIPDVLVAVTTRFIPCQLIPYYIYPGTNIHPSMAPGETLRAPGVHPGLSQYAMQQIYTQVWVMQPLYSHSHIEDASGDIPQECSQETFPM
ncbi:phosphatase and actin regulator 3 [Anopheles sinensis]|uniref:Phosphatase and actin regulator 3 n=1 Tax=Anopheles sinensis TaxID=74873 RepID=A0A084VH30_ANOSI|nr:phosphatase and actin regulator 3 [Anopheles sinensis]